MEELRARLLTTSKQTYKKKQTDIYSLITGPLENYLTNYQPKRQRPRKKITTKQEIGAFEDMVPYTITLMGYVTSGFDIKKLYEHTTPTAEEWEKGKIRMITSPNGKIKTPDGDELPTLKFLPNHTSIGLWLDNKDQYVLLRISSYKFEVLGCRNDQDIDTVWFYLKQHINNLDVDIRLDKDTKLEFYKRYGAMRNYSVHLGYQLDIQRLAFLISDMEDTKFKGMSNPSLQVDLRLSHPFLGDLTDIIDKSATRKRRNNGTKDHIFRVFHTGKCLYSGKGDLEECKMVFESFRRLMDGVRDRVEIQVDD